MSKLSSGLAGATLAALLAVAAATALAGEALVDMDLFNQERALWAGTAETNRITAAEIARLRSEVARLEPIMRSNEDLRAHVRKLNEIAGGIISNNFLGWNRSDGKSFIAKLTGDDGEHAEMSLVDGRTGQVDRIKLADADIEFLNLLKAWRDSSAAGAGLP